MVSQRSKRKEEKMTLNTTDDRLLATTETGTRVALMAQVLTHERRINAINKEVHRLLREKKNEKTLLVAARLRYEMETRS